MNWGGGCLQGPDQVATLACIPYVFNNVIFWVGGLAAITTVFFVIFAGIKFINSGGDPKQVEGARKTITFAIIGFVIVLLSFTIIKAVAAFTGASAICTFFGVNLC